MSIYLFPSLVLWKNEEMFYSKAMRTKFINGDRLSGTNTCKTSKLISWFINLFGNYVEEIWVKMTLQIGLYQPVKGLVEEWHDLFMTHRKKWWVSRTEIKTERFLYKSCLIWVRVKHWTGELNECREITVFQANYCPCLALKFLFFLINFPHLFQIHPSDSETCPQVCVIGQVSAL